MKRDVKENVLPAPLGDAQVFTSSPIPFLSSFLEGLLVLSLWLAAISSGEANLSCLSQFTGFMKSVCTTPFSSEATQAERWLMPTMILCEVWRPQLFSVIRGGIGLTRRLGAGLQHTEGLNERMDTGEPEHRTNQLATTEA